LKDYPVENIWEQLTPESRSWFVDEIA